MPTKRQKLGTFGEELVRKHCFCPSCKRQKTFKLLPNNFKCADVICDFCGYMAQVKTSSVTNIDTIPKKVLGGAWSVQKERMDAGIYFSLYLVLVNEKNKKEIAVYYLPSDLQYPRHFVKRPPLKPTARRAGWQGFYYNFSSLRNKAFTRIYKSKN